MPTLLLPPGKWAAGHGWTSPSQITAWSGTWLEVGLGEGSPQAQTLLVLPEDWVVGRNGSVGPQSLAMTTAAYLDFEGQAPGCFWLRWGGTAPLCTCSALAGVQHSAEV